MKHSFTSWRLPCLAAGLLLLGPLAGQAQTLTFDDEFNSLDLSGKGAWHPNSWYSQPNGRGPYDDDPNLAAFFINPNYAPLAAANPFSITNGVLDIAIKPTPSSINPADVNNKPYVTGSLQTDGLDYLGSRDGQGHFSQRYGYFEMRAKLPAGNGVGGAFWLLPHDHTGSVTPEIDIMENLGEDVSLVFQTLHSDTYPVDANGNHAQKQAYGQVPGGNYSNGYHTYGVDWEADNITFYVDGKQTGQFPTPDDMRQPMYLILSDNASGPGRGWGKAIDSTTPIPAHFNIDYVRVYTSKPDLSSGGSPAPGGPAPTPTAGIVSGGTYKLLARHSGKALDVKDGSTTDGGKVQQWAAYDNNPNQQWVITQQSDGTYTLTHKGTTERLDAKWSGIVDGTTVWQYAANDNSDAQRWSIVPTDNGYYKLLHKGTTKCLDVPNASTTDGVAMQLWEYYGYQNQQWQLVRLDQPTAKTATAALAAAKVSAAEAGRRALSVYPNPASEQLSVSTSLPQAGEVQLRLSDGLGRVVRQRTQAAEAGAQTLPLDLRGLPAGLYLLRVQQPGSPIQTQKVTIQP